MKGYKRDWFKFIEAGAQGLMNDRRDSKTADYSVVTKDGRVWAHQNNACHAALRKYNYTYKGKPILCINGIQFSHAKMQDKEKCLKVIDYLTNRSPYKDAFLHKSAKRIWDQGYFVVHGGVKSHILGGACVAPRIMWEHGQQLPVFCALVEKGVDENLAFYLAHCCSTDGKKFIIWGRSVGHSVLYTEGASFKFLKYFVNGYSPVMEKQTTWYESGIYDGYSKDAWVGPYEWYKELLRFLGLLKLPKVDLVEKANPFAKAAPAKYNGEFSFEQGIQVIVDNLPLIMKEIEHA